MSRPPLALRRIEVRRMPGITDGGFTLDALSPGVNVVWGPNGCGKTTTARAAEALLWPASSAALRPQLAAEIDLAGAAWRVDVDGGAARWQRAGEDADAPHLPPSTLRDRYHLSLHELLAGTDDEVARMIVRESAGGFDVEAARDALGCRRAAPPAGAPRREVEAARQRVRDAAAAQASLEAEARGLDDRRAEREKARAKAGHRTLMERALERLDALEAARAAGEAVAAFPAGLGGLLGDEEERLEVLRTRLADAEERVEDARGEVEGATNALARTGLGNGLPAGTLAALMRAQDEVAELAREEARLAQAVAAARASVDAAFRPLAGSLDGARAAALTLPEVESLDALAQRAQEVRASAATADTEARWLGDRTSTDDATTLGRGRDALAAWLRAPEPSAGAAPPLRLAAIAAAVLAVAAGVALGLLAHPGGYGAAALGLALLAFVLLRRETADDKRDPHRQAYGKTKLPEPAAWTPDAVAQALDALETRLAAARDEERRDERRRELAARRAQIAADEQALAAERDAAARALGIDVRGEATLYWLVRALTDWQHARAAADAAEAAHRLAAERHRAAAEALESRIFPFAVGEIGDGADVAVALEDLKERERSHDIQTERLSQARARLRLATDDAAAAREERAKLLARAGLDADDEARLVSLCRMHGAWKQAVATAQAAAREADAAERRLRETPGFGAPLLGWDRAALESYLVEVREAEGTLDGLSAAITALELRVGDARRGHDLEAAVAEAREREDALREARTRDEGLVVGYMLATHVQRETRDAARPEVFRRASHLFAAFTRGRYRLELSQDDPPRFRAFDEREHRGCALDELSRGTRLQLLLAVRIAHVEWQEGGARLPLLFDEALGNSDGRRAQAVVDAVAELAREGRQVFYFTARTDEAERWIEAMEAAVVPHRLVDLAAARGAAQWREMPRVEARGRVRHRPPAPGAEMTHEEYGDELRVPGLFPHAEGGGALHLWYLTDDPALLHRLLSRGVERWGELRTLVDVVGDDGLGDDAAALPRLEASARVMEHVMECCRVGRGRPVDRDALVATNAVSANFLNDVETLAGEVGGRADALLEALERRDLARFRQKAILEMRAHFEASGHLDPRPPMTADEIRESARRYAAPDLRAGLLTLADVDRLVALALAAMR